MASNAWFDLSAADWQQLRALLDEALALPATQRDAWLQGLDASVPSVVRQRLTSTLASASTNGAAADDWSQGPRLGATPPPAAHIGRRVGPYRVLSLLGHGGMGSVWLAERADGLHRRQVALKLPHGAWHRPELAERLVREREILAALEHPHIARLYDAGISTDAEAQPWLAIEYVDGVRLDEHCRQQGLAVAERLKLFLQVCEAVAHAHARLVVHRDLKPANILIDRQGQVKLLDFGIAKLLEAGGADSDLTQQHGQALTPDYAAPEQILGQPLSTAADVYALGVVLFELLTGERPFRRRANGSARPDLQAVQAEGEPPRPSQRARDRGLAKALQGDLDTIVQTALRHDPAERYATVAALGEDLRRHLADEPLLARPEGAWSRWRRFARRHRSAVAATAIALLALVGGSALALWQAHEARTQRDLALAAQRQAQAEAKVARAAERAAAAEADLSSFLLSDLSSNSPEQDMVRQLDRATAMVRAQYRDEPSIRGRMLVNLALNYRWISLHDRADRLFAEAGPLLRAHGPPPWLAHWVCLQAATSARAGDLQTARAQLQQAHALLDGHAEAAAIRGECLLEEALVLRYAGEAAQAAQAAEQSLREFEQAGRGHGEMASEAMNVMARARGEAGEFAAAVKAARNSVALLEQTGRDATPGFRNAWGLVARGLRDGGRPLEALAAHGANGRFDAADPELPTPVRMDLAETLIQLQRFDAAEQVLRAIDAKARADGDTHQTMFVALARVQAAVVAGRPQLAQRARAEAERAMVPLRQGKRAMARRMLINLAEHSVLMNRLDEAAALLAELDTLQPVGAVRTPDIRQERHRVQSRLQLARGQAPAALEEADAALVLARATAIEPGASLYVARALLTRAAALLALGRTDESRTLASQAAAQAQSAGGADHPLVAVAQQMAR